MEYRGRKRASALHSPTMSLISSTRRSPSTFQKARWHNAISFNPLGAQTFPSAATYAQAFYRVTVWEMGGLLPLPLHQDGVVLLPHTLPLYRIGEEDGILPHLTGRRSSGPLMEEVGK